MSSPLLQLQGVCKSYHQQGVEQPVLRQLDLQLMAGEVVVLEGPSGEGKSTLLHLIAGLLQPDSGTLSFDGCQLNGCGETQWCQLRRRQIGLIFQFFNLVPTLTVLENLQLGFVLERQPPDEQAIAAQIAQLGLGERQDHFPQQLSGGEQQRVAIARTLLQRPQLILADEPTGNLDRENASRVMELFVQQVRDSGCALLIATHDTSLKALADRSLKLTNGVLCAA